MKLADRTSLIKPSPTLAISAKAKALKEAGHDVVSFGAGEPDFDTPEHIKQAAWTAMQKGDTKYTAVGGSPQMKAAVIAKFKRDNGVELKPSEVMVSCGGKHILYNAMLSLVNPGDEVLIPAPYWVSYPDMAKLAGGTPVFVEPKDHEHWAVTAKEIEAKITPKSRVLILNSPCNPTGSGLSHDELEAILTLAMERRLFVISDEIYEKLTFGDFAFTSATAFLQKLPALRENLLIAHGVAKTYSMTGWRIGYCMAPPALIEAMQAQQGASTSNPVSFAQAGAIAALTGPQESVETMRVAFEQRAKLIVDLLNDIPGVHCAMPRGAFYVFPNVSGALKGRTDGELTAYLLDTHHLAVVPGSEFGAPGHLRLSFATSEAQIKKGLSRLKSALQ